jgi:hypothetical protein
MRRFAAKKQIPLMQRSRSSAKQNRETVTLALPHHEVHAQAAGP